MMKTVFTQEGSLNTHRKMLKMKWATMKRGYESSKMQKNQIIGINLPWLKCLNLNKNKNC